MTSSPDQWHFWPDGEGAYDAWSVTRLERLAATLPVLDVPVASIRELDTAYWSESPLTVREVVAHLALLRSVDTSRPIILGPDGRLVDGMHRVALALLDGRPTLPGVRLGEVPAPDTRHVAIGPDGQPAPSGSPG